MLPTGVSTERRLRRRYDVDLIVRFKATKKGVVISTGTGRAVNMSSKAIAFITHQTFDQGTKMELSVGWPTLLDGQTPIKVVVKGKVVRSDGQLAAVEINQYEFRTQKRD